MLHRVHPVGMDQSGLVLILDYEVCRGGRDKSLLLKGKLCLTCILWPHNPFICRFPELKCIIDPFIGAPISILFPFRLWTVFSSTIPNLVRLMI